jgi:hypothetical protein
MPGTLKGSDYALTEADNAVLAKEVIEVFKVFANGLDDTSDLEEQFDDFCKWMEYDAEESQALVECLVESTKNILGDAEDNQIKSFLADLNKPYPKPSKTSPNKSGMTAGETGIRKFLQSLTVAAHGDPYGNNWGKDAVKVFDRKADRYGHDNVEFNLQPNKPLRNPTLNVAFEAVDSVGMGQLNQWRVVNALTGNYVTTPLRKEEAIVLASRLNDQYVSEVERQLDEAIESSNSSGQGYDEEHKNHPLHQTLAQDGFDYSHSTPIHQKNGNIFIHHTWANQEHKVGAFAGSTKWSSKVSSASGHQHSGEGADQLAKHLKSKGARYGLQKQPDIQKESAVIPQTEIQENILTPLSPQFLAAFKKANEQQNRTLSASSSSTSPMNDIKAAALLVEQRKRKFNENDVTEENAIRSRSQEGLRKK